MSPQGYKKAFVKINISPLCPPSFTSGGMGNCGDETLSLFPFLNPSALPKREGERDRGRKKDKTGEESAAVLHPETSKNWRTLQLCLGNTSKGLVLIVPVWPRDRGQLLPHHSCLSQHPTCF